MKPGWYRPLGANAVHYFEEDGKRAICGARAVFVGGEEPIDNPPVRGTCYVCKNKHLGEKDATH